MPIGAELVSDDQTHIRVWAARCERVAVVSGEGKPEDAVELATEGNGYFSGVVALGAGSLYRLRLDDDEQLYPDPISRFQPSGPHGPSRVVDPSRFAWTDAGWPGARLEGQIIYELHVGTFTREGTWAAAAREIPELAALGVTCLEMMPIAEFAGRFGWGYDGVDLFAPTRLYGEPDDLRRFVDEAHRHGVAVILDVVYNHFGPDGNYLQQFSPRYVSDRHRTEWGEALNFDGVDSAPVREFVCANARYWIDEFHMDGLRLDATQSIFDDSAEHILTVVAHEVREAARGRATILVAENEPQHARLVRPRACGGFGLDGLWNDDLHHSAMVALTGKREAYYTDYHGAPQELISAVKYGYLYQGQQYKWQRRRRGAPALDVPAPAFVTFIQNHDQVANSLRGERVHHVTSPGRYRAMTAFMLLAPGTPMLFQGQEFAASAPFLYFADHKPDLAQKVREGRAAFLAQFASLAVQEAAALLPDPSNLETFERCKLDLAERERHGDVYAMHKDLVCLRRTDPVFGARPGPRVDGAVLGAQAFLLRFFGSDGADRLLVVNLGAELSLSPVPEPLLAPPADAVWSVLWSSEHPRYGGSGAATLETRNAWRIPGHAATVLSPQPAEEASDPALADGEITEEEETRREVLRVWSAASG